MPLYEFRCRACGQVQEAFYKVDECPQERMCESCLNIADKIISRTSHQSEEPLWLDDSVRWAVQNETERKTKPIQTRTELTQCLKEKNLVPVG